MHEEHGGGVAANLMDGRGGAGPFDVGGWLSAQEEAYGLMGQGLHPLRREPLEIGRAIEADDRLDAGWVVRPEMPTDVPRSAARWPPADCP